jgi:hypothetical protein
MGPNCLMKPFIKVLKRPTVRKSGQKRIAEGLGIASVTYRHCCTLHLVIFALENECRGIASVDGSGHIRPGDLKIEVDCV